MHLSKYTKNCGDLLKKPVDSSGCAAAIELSENNVSSNQMTGEIPSITPTVFIIILNSKNKLIWLMMSH